MAPPAPSYDILQHPEPSSSSYQRSGPTLVPPVPTPTLAPPTQQQEAIFVFPDGSLQKDLWAPPNWPLDADHSAWKGKQRALDDEAPLADSETLHTRLRRDQSSAHRISDEHTTSVFQDQWTKFIWNARIPDFIGLPGTVDIYLYHADSGALVQKWTGIPNVQGQIDVNADDAFWDYRMSQWQPGEQIPYTYYYIIVKSGTALTGGESRLATWTAIQTALADSVYASATSVASVSSGSTASVASSLSALGPTSLSIISVSSASWASVMATETAGRGGSLQGTGNDHSSGFPAWAIALLVVLGVLAFASMAGLFYLLIQTFRQRNRRRSDFTNRESLGSSSPMMGQAPGALDPHAPRSPDGMSSPPTNYGARPSNLGVGMAAGLAGASAKSGGNLRPSSNLQTDGASARSVSDAGPISGQDAAIMADAFRLALRKPDFADRPVEEGESPNTHPSNHPSQEMGVGTPGAGKSPDPGRVGDGSGMLGSALAEEGNPLRNVGSARGVTVQHPSDDSIGSRERKTP
ncbi:hypothetical protein FRB96_001458 [Tulasnella sp. 330]|nr:hypothetical protein FRB96_001458 [Tulasnella sp. 330]